MPRKRYVIGLTPALVRSVKVWPLKSDYPRLVWTSNLANYTRFVASNKEAI